MKLTINLATRRYLNLRRLNGVLILSLVLLGGVALLKVRQIAGNAAEISRLQELTAATGTRVGGVAVSAAQLKALGARIRFANAVLDKKSQNWINLLDRLEEVVPGGVALTQIEPDRGGALKVTGAGRSFANIRTLLENMEHSPNFSEVYLLSQSEAKVGLTQQGVIFNISCKVALR